MPSPGGIGAIYQQIIQQLMSMIMNLLKRGRGRMPNRPMNQNAPGRNSGAGQAGRPVNNKPNGKLEDIGGKQAVRVDGPGGFLWKPVSDGGSKKLAVLIPKELTENARGVVIRSPNGRVIGQGDKTGNFGDGRGIFRFDKEGGQYPPNSIVEVQMRDGTVKRYQIVDTGQRYD
jgi:hypothetical protein